MQKLRFATFLAAGVLALAPVAFVSAASAEVLHFAAHLDGAQETPPNDSKGMGMAKVTLDTTTHALTWSVDYSGLSGPATMAHIHGPAPMGKAWGVVVKLGPAVDSPIVGEGTLTSEQEAWLRGGQLYVNVHTAAHPGGEIRGQLEMAP
jgi:hypothetical protein